MWFRRCWTLPIAATSTRFSTRSGLSAGGDAIRRWSDAEFIGKQVSLAVTGVENDGARTVVGAEVGGNGFNGPSHFSFDVDGSKVARLTIRA